jgi:hypothetical protein
MGDDTKRLPLLAHWEPEARCNGAHEVVYPKALSNGNGFHHDDDVCVAIPPAEQDAERFACNVEGERARIRDAVALFSHAPWFGKLPVIDPFFNKTPVIVGLYASLKCLLLLPLLLLRLLVIGLILVLGFIATKLALLGWKKDQEVLPRWRRNLMIGTRLCGRAVLFCFG